MDIKSVDDLKLIFIISKLKGFDNMTDKVSIPLGYDLNCSKECKNDHTVIGHSTSTKIIQEMYNKLVNFTEPK